MAYGISAFAEVAVPVAIHGSFTYARNSATASGSGRASRCHSGQSGRPASSSPSSITSMILRS